MKQRLLLHMCAVLLICVLGLTVGLAVAQEDTPDADELRQKLIDGAAALTSGEYAALDDLLAESYVVHSPLGSLDRAGLEGFFDAMRAALTDFEMERQVIIVEGNMAASRFTMSGVFENDFMGPMGLFPPTGEPVSIPMINVFEFDDTGKVVEEWVRLDLLDFMIQFGAMPPPA